jgi:hypothetical protein
VERLTPCADQATRQSGPVTPNLAIENAELVVEIIDAMKWPVIPSFHCGQTKCGQQRIGSLADEPKGVLSLLCDLRWGDRSDVLNIPYLKPVPGRLDPALAKTVVFRLHEHEHITCSHEGFGRPLPTRRCIGIQAMPGQQVRCVG